MEIKNLCKGMYVYINPRCPTTELKHGLINTMMKLMGTVQKIEDVNSHHVIINHCSWDPKDLSWPKKEKIKPIKSITFDSNELVL